MFHREMQKNLNEQEEDKEQTPNGFFNNSSK
jgi:hypothetical protein